MVGETWPQTGTLAINTKHQKSVIFRILRIGRVLDPADIRPRAGQERCVRILPRAGSDPESVH